MNDSREEDLFTAALALPAAERAAFLEKECAGDASLRARLEVLLNAHDGASSLLEPSISPPRPSPWTDESPGDMIGHYRLLEKVGEGGCGVVYVAEQREPVRRRVALKII